MNRVSRSVVAVCAVASLFVTGVGVSPVSAKTVNGCVIKAKTKCVNANLRGANLKGANLTNARLKGANLTKATLNKVISGGIKGEPDDSSDQAGGEFHNGYLVTDGVNLKGADLSGLDASDFNFSNINFSHANLSRSNVNGCTNCNFDHATLSNADFATDPGEDGDPSVPIVGVDDDVPEGTQPINTPTPVPGPPTCPDAFSYAGSTFDHATLSGANLSCADYTGASMTYADLSHVNLSQANLTKVNLNQTNMSNSNTTYVTWTGVTCPTGSPAAGNPLTC